MKRLTAEQVMTWEQRNCSMCMNNRYSDRTMTTCPILAAIYESVYGDGMVPDQIAEQMNYQRTYTWDCPQYVGAQEITIEVDVYG